MAKKTIIQLVDDITGESIGEGQGRSVRFAFDGVEYEIDLTNAHAAEMSNVFARYVRSARRVVATRAPRGSKTIVRNPETAQIRAWARDLGIQISDRGRIPADVIERYRNR